MIREAHVYFRARFGPESTIHWGKETEGYCIVTVDTSKSTQPSHLRRDLLFIETAYRPYGSCVDGPCAARDASQSQENETVFEDHGVMVHNGLDKPILVKTFYGLIQGIRFMLSKS